MSGAKDGKNTGVKITAGQAPKICVSIAEAGRDAIIKEAASASDSPADMIEWRADAYPGAREPADFLDTLKMLKRVAAGMPIMFTYRTDEEGGEGSSDPGVYETVTKTAIESGCVDMVDVQVLSEAAASEKLIMHAHSKGVAVVASYHDFGKTPPAREICERYEKLKESGADVIKIAVMATNEEDAGRLLEAATNMRESHPEWPLVAIAMGEAGMQSRIEAERFGSCIIYAAGSKQTAPGQIDVYQLAKLRSARK